MPVKLYPPQIKGTIPAFWINYDSSNSVVRGADIKIPFGMNQSVSASQIKGFTLRLRTASTGSYLFSPITSTDFNLTANEVTFHLSASDASKLNEGQYYKVQIAYNGSATTNAASATVLEDVGYFSTVGIIKCTSKPMLSINNLTQDSINLFQNQLVGLYDTTDCRDQTEKVYSYQFIVYDNDNNVYYTTGEQLHKSYYDTNANSSLDTLFLNDFIREDETYSVQYKVTTINGLELSSPKYKLTANGLKSPNKSITILPEVNDEKGYITINFKGELDPDRDNAESLYYGAYILQRASDADNYTTWYNIGRFRLDDAPPSSYFIKDITIEHGRKYRYALTQYNLWGMQSEKIISDICEASFEDMYLYDGEKTLRVRYNPKVSSFKITVLEQKTDTIGGRFPFITRNGETFYREFPIAGLLAEEVDVDNSFCYKYKGDLHRHSTGGTDDGIENGFRDWHMFSDENIALEREYKMNVLEWLNNGKPKLFKSPYEGNFIVRLLNNSLTPIDELGRMLHNFQSQAYEIAECTYDNLVLYGFIQLGFPNDYVGLFRTFRFTDEECFNAKGDVELNFDGSLISFTIRDMMPGDIVKLKYFDSDEYEEIMIGITGSYTYTGERTVKQIYIPQYQYEKIYRNIIGTVDCYYYGVRITAFDAIMNTNLQTVVAQQFIGIDPQFYVLQNKTLTFTDENNVRYYYLTQEDYDFLTNYNIRDRLNSWVELGEHDNKPVYIFKSEEAFNEFKTYLADYTNELLEKINITIGNGEGKKIELLKVEQGKFRLRNLIPVYEVNDNYNANGARDYPITRKLSNAEVNELWNTDTIIYYNSSSQYIQVDKTQPPSTEQDYFIAIGYHTGNTFLIGEKNRINNTMYVSTSPYGYPHPIEELTEVELHDPFCIFQVFRRIDGQWKPIVKELQDGTQLKYYDAYYKQWILDYDPIVNIDGNDIDLTCTPEKNYKNLEGITSIRIGTAVMAELTYQVRNIDFYTEYSHPDVVQAKQNYLDKIEFFNNLLSSYGILAESDNLRTKYKALMDVYSRMLNGNENVNELTPNEKQILQTLLNNEKEREQLNLLTLYEVYSIDDRLGSLLVDEIADLITQLKIEKSVYDNTETSIELNYDKLGIYTFTDGTDVIYHIIYKDTDKRLPSSHVVYMDNSNNLTWFYQYANDSDEFMYFAVDLTKDKYVDYNPSFKTLYWDEDKIVNASKVDAGHWASDELEVYNNPTYITELQLLNDKEVQTLSEDIHTLKIVPKTYSSMNSENVNKTFFESQEIEELSDNISNIIQGVDGKQKVLQETINNFTSEIGEAKEAKDEIITQYKDLYNAVVAAYDAYNNAVYERWVVDELIRLLTVVNPADATKTPLLSIEDITNYLSGSSEKIDEAEQQLIDPFSLITDYHVAIEIGSPNLKYLIQESYKYIDQKKEIINDNANDTSLDEELQRQIQLDSGTIVYHLYILYYLIHEMTKCINSMKINNKEDERIPTAESYLTSAKLIYSTYCSKITDNNKSEYQEGLKYLYLNKLNTFNYAKALLQTNISNLRNNNVDSFGNTLLQYILSASKAYDDVMLIYNPNLGNIDGLEKNITTFVSLGNIVVDTVDDNQYFLTNVFNLTDIADTNPSWYKLASNVEKEYNNKTTDEEKEEFLNDYQNRFLLALNQITKNQASIFNTGLYEKLYYYRHLVQPQTISKDDNTNFYPDLYSTFIFYPLSKDATDFNIIIADTDTEPQKIITNYEKYMDYDNKNKQQILSMNKILLSKMNNYLTRPAIRDHKTPATYLYNSYIYGMSKMQSLHYLNVSDLDNSSSLLSKVKDAIINFNLFVDQQIGDNQQIIEIGNDLTDYELPLIPSDPENNPIYFLPKKLIAINKDIQKIILMQNLQKWASEIKKRLDKETEVITAFTKILNDMIQTEYAPRDFYKIQNVQTILTEQYSNLIEYIFNEINTYFPITTSEQTNSSEENNEEIDTTIVLLSFNTDEVNDALTSIIDQFFGDTYKLVEIPFNPTAIEGSTDTREISIVENGEIQDGAFLNLLTAYQEANIDNKEQLITEAEQLLVLYNKQTENYREKFETYEQIYSENEALYNSFKTAYPVIEEYYTQQISGDVDLNDVIQNARNDIAQAWKEYIMLLDQRYREEKESGLYV